MSDLSEFYFKPEPEIICGDVVPPIIDYITTDHPTVVERFFTKYYYCRDDAVDEMHSILFHSNRICLVGLDRQHVAVTKGITSINFDIGNCDRSKNQVSGKGKRGAMNLQPLSTLAIVTCADGSEYKVISTIMGKLVEVNERLRDNLKLIGVDGDGYIAVVLPKIEKCVDIKSQLFSKEEYQAKLSKSNTMDESGWNGIHVVSLLVKIIIKIFCRWNLLFCMFQPHLGNGSSDFLYPALKFNVILVRFFLP